MQNPFQNSKIPHFLCNLRLKEIGYSYSVMCQYQKEAGEGNWIELFMQEYVTVPDCPWTDYAKEQEEKLKIPSC